MRGVVHGRKPLFPAQAGVILIIGTIWIKYLPVPRASGGDPDRLLGLLYRLYCSPRKRG